ncbi:hypothetical protein [Flavobacterium lacisediminis]|uniref:Lipoprotein n=1 Tax=Flavobacterium lacisediminis TaxID=2989705 RepID=A0ABT3EHJ2_9FLAO|nr:hypothetical protein [Flavobacterium lacisediminis]MCW1148038.1 hypothetical protein [Flavobacterium lacisediminis]
MRKAILLFGLSILLIFCTSKNSSSEKIVKIDINDTEGIKKYIQGEWEYNLINVDHIVKYRFYFHDNKVKVWSSFLKRSEQPFVMEKPIGDYDYEISGITEDENGYKIREIGFSIFSNQEVKMDVRALFPVKITLDSTYLSRTGNNPYLIGRETYHFSRGWRNPDMKYNKEIDNKVIDNPSTSAQNKSSNRIDENFEEEINETKYEELPLSQRNEIALNEHIKDMYEDIMNNKFDATKYYSDNVDLFITRKNIKSSEITKLYRNEKEYVNQKFTIKDNIYRFQVNDNITYYRYTVDYSCFRVSKNKNQSCKVYIEIGIGEDGIKSYKELKVENIKFY